MQVFRLPLEQILLSNESHDADLGNEVLS